MEGDMDQINMVSQKQFYDYSRSYLDKPIVCFLMQLCILYLPYF
jgi:hypothetical protein